MEQVNLSWKLFPAHLESTFKDLAVQEHFADVTLVSDDQIQIKAHKLVLSSASPVLRTLLLTNPHSHPLLYMRGVKHQELLPLLQWMYFGEADVCLDSIEEFMKIGKKLEVTELNRYL